MNFFRSTIFVLLLLGCGPKPSVRSDAGADAGVDAGTPATPLPPSAFNPTDGGTVGVTLSVDFSAVTGARVPYELYNNIQGPSTGAAQRSGDMSFFNAQGLHGRVWRVWTAEGTIYNPSSKSYTYPKSLTDYLADVSTVSDALLINFTGTSFTGSSWNMTPAQVEPVVETIVKHLKQTFSKIRYVEGLNEPDLAGLIFPEDAYAYYAAFATAVKNVNASLGLSGDAQILVGGPALARFDLNWLTPFLQAYAKDDPATRRLDYVSFHVYNHRETIDDVAAFRPQLEDLLEDGGVSTAIPSFITEYGLFPGSLTDSNDVEKDQFTQAAGMATHMFYFAQSAANVPFHWDVRHSDNERKDQLVTRPTPASGVFTPYGNVLKLWSLLKSNNVSATSTDVSGGKGTFVVGSEDDTGVSVAAWRYTHQGTTGSRASIYFHHLPAALKGVPVRVERFVINRETSNSYRSLENANLQRVQNDVGLLPDVPIFVEDFEPNSLQLIRISPAP